MGVPCLPKKAPVCRRKDKFVSFRAYADQNDHPARLGPPGSGYLPAKKGSRRRGGGGRASYPLLEVGSPGIDSRHHARLAAAGDDRPSPGSLSSARWASFTFVVVGSAATSTSLSDPGEHVTDGRCKPLAAASRRDAPVIERACDGPQRGSAARLQLGDHRCKVGRARSCGLCVGVCALLTAFAESFAPRRKPPASCHGAWRRRALPWCDQR